MIEWDLEHIECKQEVERNRTKHNGDNSNNAPTKPTTSFPNVLVSPETGPYTLTPFFNPFHVRLKKRFIEMSFPEAFSAKELELFIEFDVELSSERGLWKVPQ